MNPLKVWRYLHKRERRPLLPRGYHVHGDSRDATEDERVIIARRLARTPNAARLLIEQYGSVRDVLRNVEPPQRKKPPVFRRLGRFVRYWFPGG